MFYHDRDYSPNFDKARSVRTDSLFFNDDGTIKKVIPTFRGVGLTNATKEIQIDRYSKIDGEGIYVAFIDTLDKFKGWKIVFKQANAWVQYNSVDFGKKPLRNVLVRALSKAGGSLQLHSNRIDGPIVAEIKIPKDNYWKMINTRVKKLQPGVHNLFVVSRDNNRTEVDWIKFQ